MNYQEERMKDLIGSLPQNRNVEWDSVAPVIDFEFSRNADPSAHAGRISSEP